MLVYKADTGLNQIHGVLVRWSYESLVLAGFDVEVVLTTLGGLSSVDHATLDEHLAACRPDPRTIPPDEFMEAFRNPQGCLEGLARSAGWRRLKKGDPRKDQAVAQLSQSDLERLVGRVPDLIRVLKIVTEQATMQPAGASPAP